MDIVIGGLGLLGWGAVFLLARQQKLSVRYRLRITDLEIDSAGIEDNPRWVQEQVVARLSHDEWRELLPLVAHGWNGGFPWLTPEFVREQLRKELPA